jgi:hypothetical protein
MKKKKEVNQTKKASNHFKNVKSNANVLRREVRIQRRGCDDVFQGE